MTDAGRVEDLLADRPDLESPLAALLAIDEETDTWTFDDVPVESGPFGELVARGVVERDGDEYSLADPEAVRHALADEPATDAPAGADDAVPAVDIGLPEIDVDARAAGLLGSALALVAVLRSFVVPSVFRDGDVVLSGNDPYFYLYWVEQSLAAGGSPQLPAGITKGEPLLVATLARLTGLFGGAEAAGAVLAVYPVVSAILTGALLYWLTMRLTADRRIALAAVVVLAAMPGHALRTALGFADHHAFDYVWLTLTAAALVVLAGTDRDDLAVPGTWLAALALGVGVGGSTLAWDAGPLMVVPVGAVVAARVLVDVRAGRSPLVANVPLLAGLGLGALLTLYGHRSLGWHTTVVAAAPVLLLGGAVAVVAVGELAARLDRRAAELAVAEAAVALAGGTLVWVVFPAFRTELLAGLDRVFRSDDIVETRALFSGDTLGFLLLFGLFLVLVLPVLAWATRRTVDDARWAVACSYGWYFFVLSLFQVRFTGQLGIFMALFAGLGFVWLAAWIDLTPWPAPFDTTANGEFATWTPGWPDAATVGAVLVLFLLVGGLGLVQSAVKVEQVTTDDADYETAAWLADYADRQGWESRSESYVFSRWGKNRLYNYFVNGDSRSYGYAQSNYGSFVSLTDPQAAANLIGGRVRFVVTETQGSENIPPESMQARLHDNLGSRSDGVAGLGRFRAVYATADGDRKAFVFVPGATVRGTAAPNTTVEVATGVDIPGASFTYTRRTSTNETGAYSVRVAQPGTYEVATANGPTTVTVPETAVMNGTSVTSPDS